MDSFNYQSFKLWSIHFEHRPNIKSSAADGLFSESLSPLSGVWGIHNNQSLEDL